MGFNVARAPEDTRPDIEKDLEKINDPSVVSLHDVIREISNEGLAGLWEKRDKLYSHDVLHVRDEIARRSSVMHATSCLRELSYTEYQQWRKLPHLKDIR